MHALTNGARHSQRHHEDNKPSCNIPVVMTMDEDEPFFLLHFSLQEITPIHLVPELCSRTGLTDKMREDFKVMKVGRKFYGLDFLKQTETLQKEELIRDRHRSNCLLYPLSELVKRGY